MEPELGEETFCPQTESRKKFLDPENKTKKRNKPLHSEYVKDICPGPNIKAKQ